MTTPISSSMVLKHLLLALNESSDVTYNEDDQSDFAQAAQHLDEDTTEITGLEITEANRDLFHGGKSVLSVVKSSVEGYSTEDDPQFNLSDALGMATATPFFYASQPNDSGEDVVIWVGNRSDNTAQNWLLCLDTYVGEYYDDDYDLNVTISIHTHIAKADIDAKIKEVTNEWVSRHVSQFTRSLEIIQNSLPVALHASFQDQVLNRVQQEDLFKPVLAQKQNQELASHVDSQSEDAPRRKPATKL